MKRSKKLSGRADVAAHPDLMRGLILFVIEFMARTGMSNNAIRKVFLQCMPQSRAIQKANGSSGPSSIAYGCDTVAGAVLRAWHKFPIYIDSAARPLCLRLDGPEPNLTSLVLSQDRHADAKAVIQSMLNAGLVRKKGLKAYLPEKDAATIGSLDPLAVDHIAKTIMRLVETATRNMAKSKGKLRLIERYAHVPDLTKSEALAFAAFSRQQGQACLDAIEDWLEARQTKYSSSTRKSKRGVNAGVHIFAYLGEPATAKKRPSAPAVSKRSRPAPEARA